MLQFKKIQWIIDNDSLEFNSSGINKFFWADKNSFIIKPEIVLFFKIYVNEVNFKF